MRSPTERQTRRREAILGAARKLIGERGFEGVTMRDLAKESGVTPKTLYHQFESKEKLLQTAVEERFRYVYQTIDEAQIERGIDRLFFIVDTVASTTAEHREYAKALAPMMNRGIETGIGAVRKAAYRRAVLQIAEESEIEDWINLELLADIIYRQVAGMSHLKWYEKETSKNPTFSLVKLEVSLILRSVTTGYTQQRVTETIREIQDRLKGGRLG